MIERSGTDLYEFMTVDDVSVSIYSILILCDKRLVVPAIGKLLHYIFCILDDAFHVGAGLIDPFFWLSLES